jgi:hypothetical protein
MDRIAYPESPANRIKKVRIECPTVGPTDAELELLNAMQAYKESSGRMFPTWSEVLEVLTGLGYEKAGCARPEALASPPGRVDADRAASLGALRPFGMGAAGRACPSAWAAARGVQPRRA